jgi:hypothetical protein
MHENQNSPEDFTTPQPPDSELQELGADIKWSLSFAVGSVATAGASVYATYAVATGENPDLAPIAAGSGTFLVSAGTALRTIPQAVSLIRRRNSLSKEADAEQK